MYLSRSESPGWWMVVLMLLVFAVALGLSLAVLAASYLLFLKAEGRVRVTGDLGVF